MTKDNSSERITFTLFPQDVEVIKRLRNGIFADVEIIANTSEVLRYLLRHAPDKLDSASFLDCREKMQTEDGRGKKRK
jgi:hypothetical protein